MVAKTPIRTVFNESGTATGLAEFQTGEFVAVEHGGTGNVTLTSNSILLGNGTSAVQSSTIQISGNTISASDSTIISINDGLSVTGSITSGNLLPPTDNTGVVGTNDLTWSDGRFTDLTIDDVLTVRTAIDLADGDVLRFGDNDDFKIYHDGTANRFDLITRDLTIRDDTTTRFTFGRTTGNFTTTGDITVGGNLTVNGTTTTVNSTTIEITNSFTFEGSTADDYETVLGVVDPTADRTINLPNASGTIVLQDTTDTLTNKTLTSPIISSISNTGTLTLPTSTDTLVGRATTDTLTNKTINSASNTITITESNISDLQSYILANSTDTLTNKTIDADNNTITNIGDSELSSGISATKIGNGDVDNTELSYLNGVTSSIQTQINTKASQAFAIAQAVALG